MTIHHIQHHLESTIGSELLHDTISKITDEVLDEVLAWQSRPLEVFCPVIYLDALVVKIRDGAHVGNKAAHIAVGVDMDGVKHVLGIWIEQTVDPADRGGEVLGRRLRTTGQQGCPRRAHRLLRRPEGVPASDRAYLAERDDPDLRGSPDPRREPVREL